MEHRVEFNLTLEDYRAFAQYLKARYVGSSRGKWETFACWLMGIVSITILMNLYFFFMSIADFTVPCLVSTAFAGMTICVIWNRRTYVGRFVREQVKSPYGKQLLDTQSVVITPEGLQQHGSFGEVSLNWSTFTEIQLAEKATYFHVNAKLAIIVPRHAFLNEQECLVFMQKARLYYDPSGSPRQPCEKCGFDLRADPESGCPECGWNRKDKEKEIKSAEQST